MAPGARKPSPVHVRSVLPLVGQTPYKGFHILDRGHCLLIRTVSRVTQDRGQIAVLNVTERSALGCPKKTNEHLDILDCLGLRYLFIQAERERGPFGFVGQANRNRTGARVKRKRFSLLSKGTVGIEVPELAPDSCELVVAYGVPWLGCETAPGRVLVVNFEIQSAFACRRLNVLAEALGIKQEPGRLDCWNLRGHATSHLEIFPRIIDRIGDGGYRLIVLDPIYKLYGGSDNENGAREVAALMNSVESLAVKTGAAVAFGAHFSKGNQAAKDTIDRVSGSGVFARDPDSLLNFTKHQESDCYTVEATLRNFPPLDPFVVRWAYPLFVRDASLNPAELKTPGRSTRDKAAEQERREGEHRQRLLAVLRATPDGDTGRMLARAAGLNTDNFGRAIATLLQEGRAERCKVTKNKRDEDGFKPTEK